MEVCAPERRSVPFPSLVMAVAPVIAEATSSRCVALSTVKISSLPVLELNVPPVIKEVPPETLIRISYLLEIFQALGALYPGELSGDWLKRANTNAIYGGETALAYMLRNGVEGLKVTRQLLEARVHG